MAPSNETIDTNSWVTHQFRSITNIGIVHLRMHVCSFINLISKCTILEKNVNSSDFLLDFTFYILPNSISCKSGLHSKYRLVNAIFKTTLRSKLVFDHRWYIFGILWTKKEFGGSWRLPGKKCFISLNPFRTDL